MTSIWEEMQNMQPGAASGGIWPIEGEMPLMDMYEDGEDFVILMDLPGLRREEIGVEPADHGVTVNVQQKTSVQTEDDGRYRSEHRFLSFHQRIPLPDAVDPKEPRIIYVDNVLEIRLPMRKGR